MTSLYELYVEHDGYVSDKWSSYMGIYDTLFKSLRDRPVRLLEIGVGNGGSLQIWEKYFVNAEKIVGCDINPNVATLRFGPKVATVVGDVKDPSTLDAIRQRSETFDIIIDDGSHKSDDIIDTFGALFPFVSDGGVFVAEDLHCSYFRSHKGRLLASYSSVEFFKMLIDIINYDHWRSQYTSWLFAYIANPIRTRRLRRLPISDLKIAIRSICFYDSICVVSKGSNTSLGRRLVVGQHAMINRNVLEAIGQTLSSPAV